MCNSWLVCKYAALDLVWVDWVWDRILLSQPWQLVVDVVAHSNEFLAIVGACQHNHCNTKQICRWYTVWVRGRGLNSKMRLLRMRPQRHAYLQYKLASPDVNRTYEHRFQLLIA